MNTKRIDKLERRLSSGKRCQTCGQPYPPGKTPIEVEFRTDGEPEPKPEYCPECKRQTVYIATWRNQD